VLTAKRMRVSEVGLGNSFIEATIAVSDLATAQ
jgi:hypothetical protein